MCSTATSTGTPGPSADSATWCERLTSTSQGVLLAVGLATVLLMGLGLLLSPSLPHACPMQAWKPRWRSLGQPQVPAEYVILRDNLPFYEDLGPWGSGEGADSETAMSWGTGEPLLSQTLEDFSIRTLYDKLEDQNLHVASQLSKHRSDALAFYRATAQQLQGLQVATSIFPCEWQEDRPNPLEAGGPGGEKLGIWALKSDKALELEVRRVHLAQRIEDLEWELSLLLQVAAGSSSAGGSWSSQHASLGSTETHGMLQWPPVGGALSTENTASFPW
ncbi:uncharacterized protein LOC129023616 isoform X3 [Pongo pygmaeus]|uniref:uncharacterized protein LOC129023616 isoform X3 n=1 Tax=Pongo pygmaeus TaxID=9600 RepID=UPI0023E0D41C|nr:uncharacterized protein LOC129023616 isoform X3 [Pongo pygmaeus]